MWEEPATARSFERLASFSRLVLFDRRGTGLSDPVSAPPTLEQQMDDLAAVLDAVGVERSRRCSGPAISACARSTPPPIRTGSPRSCSPASPPKGGVTLTAEVREQFLDAIEHRWGDGTLLPSCSRPSKVGNRAFERLVGTDAAIRARARGWPASSWP